MGFLSQDIMNKSIINLDYLIKEYKKNRDLIFDLDNTIIDEKIYLYSAYKEIARKADICRYKEIYTFLKNNFLTKGRDNLYQNMISNFKIKDFELKDFLYILRNHVLDKKIITKFWFRNFIHNLNDIFPIYIITNGNVNQQKNKIRFLELPDRSFIKKIIFADEFQKKPSPESYFQLNKNIELNNPIFVGDNKIDRDFAINLNIEFIDVINFS
tara:strand:+ start:12925 stop:13563 length:639 start_codon:yes stop_codon:yes gene_type:complete